MIDFLKLNLSRPETPHLVRHVADDLDCSGSWLFWSRPTPPLLVQTLAALGQVQPVLIDGSGAQPVVIAGATQVAALVELGQNEVLCLDLGLLSAWDKGLAYVQANMDLEVTDARLVAALRYFASLDLSRLDQIFTLLGVRPDSKQARLALAWLDVPLAWDMFLARGAIPLACATVLAPLKTTDLQVLEPFFARWLWSRSNAVNFLTWLRESCLRDKIEVPAALELMQATETLEADLSPKDGINRLVLAARRLRFPNLTRLEDEFQSRLADLGGTRWRITQPDQFESNTVELMVRVNKLKALGQAVDELTNLASRKAWADLLGEKS